MKFATAAFAGLKAVGGKVLAAGSKAVGGAGGVANIANGLQAFAALRAGQAQRSNLRAQAEDARQAALVDQTDGARRQNAALREMLDTLAGQRAAFAASGLDPNIGSPLAIGQQTLREGSADIAGIGNASAARALALRMRAREYERAGGQSALDGLIGAAGFALEGAGRVADRGGDLPGTRKRRQKQEPY